MSIIKDSMVGKAINRNWGFDVVNPNEKVILNALIEKTLPVFLFFFPLNGGFRICLRNTVANRGQCVAEYQARLRPVFIGGGES